MSGYEDTIRAKETFLDIGFCHGPVKITVKTKQAQGHYKTFSIDVEPGEQYILNYRDYNGELQVHSCCNVHKCVAGDYKWMARKRLKKRI